MAMAVLANAVLFHDTISNLHSVLRLSDFRNELGYYAQSKIVSEWKRIYTEINYWPIFHIAGEILDSLRPNIANRVIYSLIEAAQKLRGIGATSQHDLSGRMLQKLIADRKFLATYYTLPSSATLLAELAVSRLNVDWSKPDQITRLQIGDFACGTGALLNAAYSSVLVRYRRTGGDDSKLHAPLIEKTLVGTDIMPAATHLTASILSSAHPAEPFLNTRILTLPYGKNEDAAGRTIDLGALDLIKEENVFSLFKTSQDRVKGSASSDSENIHIPHNSFDLVIMNPPFTRATNHAGEREGVPIPSFAGFGTSDSTQWEMADKLKSITDVKSAGNGNAGLASNFIDVATAKIKEGGVLALVIPATFATARSWDKARNVLERLYHDIMVVSIATQGVTDQAFSADTGMAEVLVIATRSLGDNRATPTVTYVNLNRRPRSIVESGVLARLVKGIDVDDTNGVLRLGNDDVAQYVRSHSGFGNFVGIRDFEIAQTMVEMKEGQLTLPRMQTLRAPFVRIGDIGERGLGSWDINDNRMNRKGIPNGPFTVQPISSALHSVSFPMLWNHNYARETKLIVEPDSEGVPLKGQRDRAKSLWDKHAGKLCINQDFRLNSQPLVACYTSIRALGGMAWPGFFPHDDSYMIPILLFANSTLGIVAHWWNGSRQQNGRSRQSISKLPDMMTVDPRGFTDDQFETSNIIFELFKDKEFLPANEAYRDNTRQELDRAVLIDLLGLPEQIMDSLELLRYKWCCEPSVHGGKSTGPP